MEVQQWAESAISGCLAVNTSAGMAGILLHLIISSVAAGVIGYLSLSRLEPKN